MSEGTQEHPSELWKGRHQDKEHFQARLTYFNYFCWLLFPRLWPPLGFAPKDTFSQEGEDSNLFIFPFYVRVAQGLKLLEVISLTTKTFTASLLTGFHLIFVKKNKAKSPFQ